LVDAIEKADDDHLTWSGQLFRQLELAGLEDDRGNILDYPAAITLAQSMLSSARSARPATEMRVEVNDDGQVLVEIVRDGRVHGRVDSDGVAYLSQMLMDDQEKDAVVARAKAAWAAAG
jgi:hypothetical protein